MDRPVLEVMRIKEEENELNTMGNKSATLPSKETRKGKAVGKSVVR